MRYIFIIYLLFTTSLFANIVLKAPNNYIKDESFIFEFEVSGSLIEFPKIEKLDGFIVESLGSSKSLQIINGNYNQKIAKKYRIIPNKDFTIPSFDFIVDGKTLKSNPKKIFEQKIEKTNSNNFDLELKASKNSLFVGEDLIVKLIFKYRKNLQITDLGFKLPHFENFWYKKLDNSNEKYEDNGFIVQELDFLLFPQKSGNLEIKPIKIDVQLVEQNSNSNFNFFGARPTLKKVYSNKLSFDVKRLPDGVDLIGDFDIKASIDKSKITLGESFTYKLDIKGIGNFDDIKDFELNIDNATIYDNKPKIDVNYSNDGLKGNYSKVFSIVPNRSLEIPSIKLKYYNKKENRVIEKSTKSFIIEVEGEKKEKSILEKTAKKSENIKQKSVDEQLLLKEKMLFFFFGCLFTFLIFCLYIYVKIQKSKKETKDTSLVKLIKKTKTKEQLIKFLIPYIKKDERLDKLIFDCENREKDFKILKKDIIEILKEMKL